MGNQIPSKPYVENIDSVTELNKNYRKVIYTTNQQQLVVMSIEPKSGIHKEIHPNTTQFIRIVKGNGKAVIDNQTYILAPETILIIPAGAEHEIFNTEHKKKMKLYTIYSPPEHPIDLVQPNFVK